MEVTINQVTNEVIEELKDVLWVRFANLENLSIEDFRWHIEDNNIMAEIEETVKEYYSSFSDIEVNISVEDLYEIYEEMF